MSVAANIKKIKEELPAHVTLIAVSKTKPVELIEEAYHAGQLHFGENKVQELVAKYESLQKDICWHMIGHLQTNKVKYIAPFVHLIHSVDSVKLLQEINKQGAKNSRIIDCLIQVYIAKEETKFGFDEAELTTLLQSNELKSLTHVRIRGLMGMATFTENTTVIRKEFAGLKQLFDQVKNLLPDPHSFDMVSMGMSGDYTIAIEEGSTMVRVGSALFGSR